MQYHILPLTVPLTLHDTRVSRQGYLWPLKIVQPKPVSPGPSPVSVIHSYISSFGVIVDDNTSTISQINI